MLKKKICQIIVLAAVVVPPFSQASAAARKTRLPQWTLAAGGSLQIPFIRNQGQADDPAVAYYADTFACRVSVTRHGKMVYHLDRANSIEEKSRAVVKERLLGAEIAVAGLDKAVTKASHYQGNDPAKWRDNLACYQSIVMGRIRPGIRLELKAHGNNVEKLFHVGPGADPGKIRMAVEGVEALRVDAAGELILSAGSEVMRFSRPVAFQYVNGQKHGVAVDYHVQGRTYGFRLGAYDSDEELVIDPLITSFVYSNGDYADFRALAADSAGHVYAAGFAKYKCVVLKLDARLEKVLAVVIFGGSQGAFKYDHDMINAMGVDSQDNIFVAGTTKNWDFPVTAGCYDNRAGLRQGATAIVSSPEGFITKFNSDLQMRASTYFGGDFIDEIYGLAVDPRDNICVTGYTKAFTITPGDVPFPVTPNAYDQDTGGYLQSKAFVSRLNNDLDTLLASTLLGGTKAPNDPNDKDESHCIAVDAAGSIYIAGMAQNRDFPTTPNCVDAVIAGASEAFVAKFDAALEHLEASTFLGGMVDEQAVSIAVDKSGDIFVGGWTESTDFPTKAGCYDTQHSGNEEDSFVVRLNNAMTELKASTLLGEKTHDGSVGDDMLSCLALSADGKTVFVAGRTESRLFPTTPGCFDDSYNGGETWHDRDPWDPDQGDGFFAAFNSDLTRLTYSTFLGGKRLDYADALLVNGGDVLVAGETTSDDFPLSVPVESNGPLSRGFISRFNSSETPADPGGNGNNNTAASGGGGGGGCFIQLLPGR